MNHLLNRIIAFAHSPRSGKLFWFVIAGTTGFCVDAAVLWVLVNIFSANAYLARAGSFAIALLATWQINRRHTFRVNQPPSVKEFTQYTISQSLGMAVNYLAYAAYLTFNPTQLIMSVAVGSVTAMVVNFVLMQRWVFKGSASR